VKTVLISGCSTGIGFTTAVTAASAGFTVIATMRDLGKSQPLRDAAGTAGVTLDIRQLDVTDPQSVSKCVEGVQATYGRLDALVNNAGISNFDPTMEMSTMDNLRKNMEVNFFGVIAVSRLAMPLLRASGGHLLTIGSVHGVVGQPFNEAYCAAKFALEGFMESLAPVAEAHGVKVSIVVPGFVQDTRFGHFPDINRRTIEAASGPYAPTFAAYFHWVVNHGWEGAGQKTQEVADVVVRTLQAERPPFRVPTNEWAADYLDMKLADRDGSVVQSHARTWIGR
jgi:NAD(P)-dependent dehydrogenase (short-subunit alcohol dehydrogenase family)